MDNFDEDIRGLVRVLNLAGVTGSDANGAALHILDSEWLTRRDTRVVESFLSEMLAGVREGL